MRDAGNGFALLAGGGAEQRAGGHEDHPPPFAAFQFWQDSRAQNGRGTAAAAAPGVHVLSFPENAQAAVHVSALRDGIAALFHQLMQDIRAYPAQIAGDYPVVISRLPACIQKMADQGIGSGGGQCQENTIFLCGVSICRQAVEKLLVGVLEFQVDLDPVSLINVNAVDQGSHHGARQALKMLILLIIK